MYGDFPENGIDNVAIAGCMVHRDFNKLIEKSARYGNNHKMYYKEQWINNRLKGVKILTLQFYCDRSTRVENNPESQPHIIPPDNFQGIGFISDGGLRNRRLSQNNTQ